MSGILQIDRRTPYSARVVPWLSTGMAFSPAAEASSRESSAVASQFERSQALFGDKSKAISELRILVDECAEANWDGYGACAVGPEAAQIAEDFLRAIPRGVELPEFAVEPDGAVSLDWIRTQNRLFSVSIDGSGRLAYSWLDGADKGYAVAVFNGLSIPARILDGVASVLDG